MKFLIRHRIKLILILICIILLFQYWFKSNHFWPLESTLSNSAGTFHLHEELPKARTEANGIAYQNKFYIVGGITEYAQTLSDFSMYDYETDTWTSLDPLPYPINHPSMIAHDSLIYVIGGFDPLGINIRWFMFAEWRPRNDVMIYNLRTESWQKGVSLPEKLGAGDACFADSAIWYTGGIAEDKQVSDAMYKFDLKSQLWEKKAPLPLARDHLRFVAIDTLLYAISGRKDDLRLNYGNVDAFNIRTETWSSRADFPYPRGGFAAVAFDGFIYTFGGEHVWTCSENIERYDPKLDKWTVIGKLPEARHGICAGVIDNGIHLISGGRHPRISVSGIHRRFEPKATYD